MKNINPQDMIQELKYNIEKKDSIKAGIVLSCIEDIDKNSQKRLVFELVRAEPEFKVPLLGFLLSQKQQLCLSFPVIEKALFDTLIEKRSLVLELLNDKTLKNKSIFINFAGAIEFEEAAPLILDILSESQHHDVIIACINTLGKFGDSGATSNICEYLYSGHREYTMAAIKALGQIGTPTAMNRLSERMGTDNEIDLLILEVFSKVQDSRSLEMLNKAIQSHHAHIRNFSKTVLQEIGAKSVPVIIENLKCDDSDLQIHSLNILGEIGDASAVAPIRKLLHNEPENSNVRFAAYEALSLLPVHEGAYTLAGGLTDPVENVSAAAAKAIDRNFNKILEAGIRNMIEYQDEDAQKIVKTIINSMSDNIFLSMASEIYFQDMATVCLARAHSDTATHYKKLLSKAGLSEFADKIHPDQEEKKERLKVYAVDDSRMILNVYKNILHELDFESTLFEFPAGAIKAIDNEKPDLVFTDLNMPEITGIELTKKIRKKYRKESLPVIMVTTQNEAQDNEAALAAGVNKVIYKPFDKNKIKDSIAELAI